MFIEDEKGLTPFMTFIFLVGFVLLVGSYLLITGAFINSLFDVVPQVDIQIVEFVFFYLFLGIHVLLISLALFYMFVIGIQSKVGLLVLAGLMLLIVPLLYLLYTGGVIMWESLSTDQERLAFMFFISTLLMLLILFEEG